MFTRGKGTGHPAITIAVALLNIAGKILTRIILNRLISYVAENVPGSQYGFRAGRGTSDVYGRSWKVCLSREVYLSHHVLSAQ